MRRLSVFVAVLVFVLAVAAEAQTYTGNRCTSGDAGSSTCTATSFSTLTSPAAVVVVVRVPNTSDTVTGITGCGSGWARMFSRVSATERDETWYAVNLGAISCAPVPTWSGADPGARMAGAEFSGIATASALDVTSVNSGSSTSFSSGATATLAQASNMAVGTCANNDYQTTFTPTGGYSIAHPPGGTENNRILVAYRVTSSTSAETFTATGDNSTNWACGVGILKAAAGGAPPGCRGLMTLLGVGCED